MLSSLEVGERCMVWEMEFQWSWNRKGRGRGKCGEVEASDLGLMCPVL